MLLFPAHVPFICADVGHRGVPKWTWGLGVFVQGSVAGSLFIGTLIKVGGRAVGGLNTYNNFKDLINKAYLRKYTPRPLPPLGSLRFIYCEDIIGSKPTSCCPRL